MVGGIDVSNYRFPCRVSQGSVAMAAFEPDT
jgi:hypothetical protein